MIFTQTGVVSVTRGQVDGWRLKTEQFILPEYNKNRWVSPCLKILI
jgi:hypothetical protein